MIDLTLTEPLAKAKAEKKEVEVEGNSPTLLILVIVLPIISIILTAFTVYCCMLKLRNKSQ